MDELKKPTVVRFKNIRLSYWDNIDTTGRLFRTYRVSKLYMSKTGTWNSSESFSIYDLRNLSILLDAFIKEQDKDKIEGLEHE